MRSVAAIFEWKSERDGSERINKRKQEREEEKFQLSHRSWIRLNAGTRDARSIFIFSSRVT